jgi:hypothetical protein
MISLSRNGGLSLAFSLRAMVFGFFCLSLMASARGGIEHSTLSSRLTVLEQSLSGVTFQLTLPSERGAITERHQALIAIPAGTPPENKILEVAYSVWDREGNLKTRGSLGSSDHPAAIKEWLRVERAVSVQPLGLVRGLRLAALQVLPNHVSLKDSADHVRLERLVFRLEFSQPGRAAEPEPVFKRPFRSGFHDVFQQIVANAKALPSGLTPDSGKDLYPSPLPYHLENSLKIGSAREGLHFLPASELSALSKEPVKPERIALFHRRQPTAFAIVRGKAGNMLPKKIPRNPCRRKMACCFMSRVPIPLTIPNRCCS